MATVLITGASRGIGLELCRQLSARGDEVIATCRTGNAALSGVASRVEEGIDVASDQAVADLAQRLGETSIDILINNAGILGRDRFPALDIEGIRRQFEVNALGPLRVTAALAGNLGPGSKVIHITSRMGSIADNTSGGGYGYRMSKAALNMAGMSMAHDLADKDIAVGIIHPGLVATDMTAAFGGGIDVSESASGILARIDELTPESSGTFWHMNGQVLPW